jgi:hypothetical protein
MMNGEREENREIRNKKQGTRNREGTRLKNHFLISYFLFLIPDFLFHPPLISTRPNNGSGFPAMPLVEYDIVQ